MNLSVKNRRTLSDFVVDFFVYAILLLLCLATVVPFLQVITVSLSPASVVNSYGLKIFPKQISWDGYIRVFQYKEIWRSYYNTIVRTLFGTLISLGLYVLGAYPLAKKYLPNRSFWTGLLVFTMYFSGGLIPSYLLVRNLGLRNTVFALILPGAINTFNLIIVRNFFMGIPAEIEEAARIDGANEVFILARIIVPLSKPVLATVALWSIVGHWNAWFDCLLYITDSSKYVLQLLLRRIIIEGKVQDLEMELASQQVVVNTESMKMATLMVSVLPIICIYPFLQKYFVKGVMIGSLKG